MNLSSLPNDKKLNLCRWYFRAGFFCLPFMWLVNAVWFFNEAFRRESYDEQKSIKKYVLMSGIGATVWTAVLIAWVVIFQTNRAAWGEMGDNISVLIPTGTA